MLADYINYTSFLGRW